MGVESQSCRVYVRIDGEEKRVDVTKQTTCYDVTRMITGYTDAVYEFVQTSNGVERTLNGKTKLSKLLRSATKDSFLSLRKADKLTRREPRASRAFKKLRELRSLMKHVQSQQTDKPNCTVLEANRDHPDTKLDLYKDKVIDSVKQSDSNNQITQGKMELMKRFLNDAHSLTSNDFLSVRREGDGAPDSPSHPRTQGDGTSQERSFSSTITRNGPISSMESDYKQRDSLLETVDNSVDFNTAFVEDTDSLLDESDISIDELEMNIINDVTNACPGSGNDTIMKLFSKTDLSTWYAEDKAMESFMKTMAEHNHDDEGVSSMSSENGLTC